MALATMRDTETGNDYFGARYYSSSSGRFLSPDWAARPTAVPYAVFGDPQSLNLYGYVRDDPVSQADADGHCASGPGTCSLKQSQRRHAALQAKKSSAQNQTLSAQATTASISALLQSGIGPNYIPPGGTETLAVTAGRINNETNGMKDRKGESMPLSEAEKLMAHQRFNAELHYGRNVQRRAGMMPPLMRGPGFGRALTATMVAAEEEAAGVDPTNGAFQYNMRTPAQVAGGKPFERQGVHTVSGPYISPSKYTYIVTYGPDQ